MAATKIHNIHIFRLKQIRISSIDLYDYYSLPETNKHVVYQFLEISTVKDLPIRLLKFFGFMNIDMTHLILLDIPNIGKQFKYNVIFVKSLYISSI